MRSPGDDGFRTPTIEDAERTLTILGVADSPDSHAHEVHTTALEAALQRVSSRAIDRPANKECRDFQSHDDYSLNRRMTDSSASTLSWKKRIQHVTWAYFTLTMATGGLANVLYDGTRELRPSASLFSGVNGQQFLIAFGDWIQLESSSS